MNRKRAAWQGREKLTSAQAAQLTTDADNLAAALGC
jgi:hypothetical protein